MVKGSSPVSGKDQECFSIGTDALIRAAESEGPNASHIVSRAWMTEVMLSEMSGIKVTQASPVRFRVTHNSPVFANR